MSTTQDSTPPTDDAWRWWESRRLRYNFGLAIAGALAWLLFVLERAWLTDRYSISISVTLAHALGWLVAMGVANLLFFLGPISERILKPYDPPAYRRRIFGLGFWFSMAVPFLFPAVALVAILSVLGF